MEGNQTVAENETPVEVVTPVVPPVETATEEKLIEGEKPLMAALSYFGPLVIIPFLVEKDNLFVKFHIKQGLVLFIAYLIVHTAGYIMFFLFPLLMLLNLGLFILSIIGVINVLNKKEQELPLVGKYANQINI